MSQCVSEHTTKSKSESWIKAELNDARRSLNDAKKLNNGEKGSYFGAISSTYYGLFHAARAAIGMIKSNLSSQHRNQQRELEKYVIGSKVPFTQKELDLYINLRKKRGDSEYKNPKPYMDVDVEARIVQIGNIIDRLEHYAKKNISN